MSYQRVEVIGNVGRDPEVRFTPGGTAVLSFSVAANEKWKNANGEQQEHTEWFRCAIFGKRAEALQSYIGKGDRIHVAGRLRTKSYQAEDGSTRYSTDLMVSDVTLLGSGQRQPKTGGRATGAATGQIPEAVASLPDDDIPF